MTGKIAFVAATAVAVLAGALQVMPVQAQNFRSAVSRTGSDTNSCALTSPCASFSGAFAKTIAGGEINCVDTGDFGPVVITKAMTIDCIGPGGYINNGTCPNINGNSACATIIVAA